MKNNTKGFTLIELLVVISIIGILSAFAAPRIIDGFSDAEKAVRDSLIGTIKSTIALAESACFVQPTCYYDNPRKNHFITVEAGTKRVIMLGRYPKPAADGIIRVMKISDGYEITYHNGFIRFKVDSDCVVDYIHSNPNSEPVLRQIGKCE